MTTPSNEAAMSLWEDDIDDSILSGIVEEVEREERPVQDLSDQGDEDNTIMDTEGSDEPMPTSEDEEDTQLIRLPLPDSLSDEEKIHWREWVEGMMSRWCRQPQGDHEWAWYEADWKFYE